MANICLVCHPKRTDASVRTFALLEYYFSLPMFRETLLCDKGGLASVRTVDTVGSVLTVGSAGPVGSVGCETRPPPLARLLACSPPQHPQSRWLPAFSGQDKLICHCLYRSLNLNLNQQHTLIAIQQSIFNKLSFHLQTDHLQNQSCRGDLITTKNVPALSQPTTLPAIAALQCPARLHTANHWSQQQIEIGVSSLPTLLTTNRLLELDRRSLSLQQHYSDLLFP